MSDLSLYRKKIVAVPISSIASSQENAGDDLLVVSEPGVHYLDNTTSELRLDPLTGKGVIIAPERDGRPGDFGKSLSIDEALDECPFCQGCEPQTPPASLIVTDQGILKEISASSNEPLPTEWRVRVVGNKYPAVSSLEKFPLLPDQTHQAVGPSSHRSVDEWTALAALANSESEPNAIENAHLRQELFQSRRLAGGHEVVIESPDHIVSLSDLDVDHVTDVFQTYAHRIRHWQSLPGVEYVSVFKNVGAPAGASLRHSHSQIIATQFLPAGVRSVARRAARHHANTGCCLQCDILRAEMSDGRRMVTASDHFVAYCPFAGRVPYFTRIVPRLHSDRFELSSPAILADLAQLTHRFVGWIEQLHPPTAYNLAIHTRPLNNGCETSFHWWMEIFPRMTKTAGFEWASDCYINPTMPENGAKRLRELAHQSNPLRKRSDSPGLSNRES